jgi:predicted mannosyl-3-phosphoglycerate phosphatase (HAD superfamily)
MVAQVKHRKIFEDISDLIEGLCPVARVVAMDVSIPHRAQRETANVTLVINMASHLEFMPKSFIAKTFTPLLAEALTTITENVPYMPIALYATDNLVEIVNNNIVVEFKFQFENVDAVIESLEEKLQWKCYSEKFDKQIEETCES